MSARSSSPCKPGDAGDFHTTAATDDELHESAVGPLPPAGRMSHGSSSRLTRSGSLPRVSLEPQSVRTRFLGPGPGPATATRPMLDGSRSSLVAPIDAESTDPQPRTSFLSAAALQSVGSQAGSERGRRASAMASDADADSKSTRPGGPGGSWRSGVDGDWPWSTAAPPSSNPDIQAPPALDPDSVLNVLGPDVRFTKTGVVRPTPPWKLWTAAALESVTAVSIMTLLTEDIKIASTDASTDDGFAIGTIVLMAIFFLEWTLMSIAIPSYPRSFFFYLDFIANASLILDIPAVLSAASGGAGQQQTASATRASRAARAGARAARLIRLMRLVAVVGAHYREQRILTQTAAAKRAAARAAAAEAAELEPLPAASVRSFRPGAASLHGVRAVGAPIDRGQASGQRRLAESSAAILRHTARAVGLVRSTSLKVKVVPADESSSPGGGGRRQSHHLCYLMRGGGRRLPLANDETRVGAHLVELIMIRVISIVLLMLFFLPLLDYSFWRAEPLLYSSGLALMHEAYLAGGNSSLVQTLVTTYVATVQSGSGPVVWLALNGTVFVNGAAYRQLRPEETEYATAGGGLSYVYVDTRNLQIWVASLSILRTVFVLCLLAGGAFIFTTDANALVLLPIERLVSLMQALANNPLLSSKEMKASNLIVEGQERFETTALMLLVGKLSKLLQLGFGEAGAAIIADNMRKSGDVQPVVPGRRVVAIYSFCDIRQFTPATEVLQETVFEYVNLIAEIVHTEVAMHGGSANKNIGDAFLNVFKFPPAITSHDIETAAAVGSGAIEDPDESQQRSTRDVNRVADRALAAILAIIAGLRRRPQLQRFAADPSLNSIFGESNFRVAMGFGLHVGWAIEGAIGSEYKIDASYLSPHVNLASRLEAATKQYGVPLLMSGEFVTLLSAHVRSGRCRCVDDVMLKGSLTPINLWTCDVNPDAITLPLPGPDDDACDDSEAVYESRSDPHGFSDEFRQHPDISCMLRSGIPLRYRREFTRGFELYKSGHWRLAQDLLTSLQVLRTVDGVAVKDGPCSALLDFMAESQFVPPVDWPGFRALAEK